MDYASLRQEGLRLLGLLTGGQWTDFNAHDPGITILEQLCYALSDLSYRISFDLPDLLAEGGSNPYACLYPPDKILSCHPVTVDDLRRLVLDVEGVNNAWIEPVTSDPPSLYYLPGPSYEVHLANEDLSAQGVQLRGLYRVFIDPAGTVDESVVRANAALRLHQSRGLGQDFDEITVLKTQPIGVDALIEIDPVDDPAALLTQIRQRLATEISPSIPFASLADMLGANVAVDEMFDGPALRHGFLTAEALAGATRRTTIHTSELMRAIMTLKGVRAVARLRISKGGSWEDWSLPIDSDRVAKLNLKNLNLVLRRAGKALNTASLPAPAATTTQLAVAASPVNPLAPPMGHDRNVGSYFSLLKQFPFLYGIGEAGLPSSAVALRKAQAKQLRAYLMFFEQILSNSFAQLAHARDLFAFQSSAQTYFTQALDQPGLGYEEILPVTTAMRAQLQSLVEDQPSGAGLLRKNRFLNHLLARVGEPIADQASSATLAQRAAYKQALLSQFPHLSSARGNGFCCLLPDGTSPPALPPPAPTAAPSRPGCDWNISGLEARARLDLALSPNAGEDMIVVEHVLLRPMEEDFIYDDQGIAVPLTLPLLAAARQADPYSLQLTFVLPDGAGRFSDPAFKQFTEQLLRERTPAHVAPFVYWMDAATWALFVPAHQRWRQLHREYLGRDLGVKQPDLPARNIAPRALELRDARDRIIDLLGLGQTYPLLDIQVTAQRPTIDFGTTASLNIWPAQVGVRYTLYTNGAAVQPACVLDGTGAPAVLTGPPITTDQTYQIQAYKIDRPARADILLNTVSVKIGLDSMLPVAMPAVNAVAPLLDYGTQVTVTVGQTQSGVTYTLLNSAGTVISVAPVVGNAGLISLQTQPMYEDTIISVAATRDLSASGGSGILNTIIQTKLPLAVRANPAAGVSVNGGAITDYASQPTITIAGSQASVVYTIYARSLVDADFLFTSATDSTMLVLSVPGEPDVKVLRPATPAVYAVPVGYTQVAQGAGNGSALQLTMTTALSEDCVLLVRAHKDHSAVAPITSDLQLTQSAAILVRPSPVPGLALQLTASAGGQSGSLLVTGGQAGAFYHFRRTGESTEVGLPAYFQRIADASAAPGLNKGVGQVWLGIDQVIEGPPATTAAGSNLATLSPPAPRVTISPLPTDGMLTVLAVKARTQVPWSASRSVAVTVTASGS